MSIAVNNEIIETLAVEQIAQNVKNFTRQSKGAITLIAGEHSGDFIEELFFKDIPDVQRRDVESSAEAVFETLNTEDWTSVKLYFKDKILFKRSDILRYGKKVDAVSGMIGQRIGDKITQYMLNRAIVAGVAAIRSNDEAVVDKGCSETLTLRGLVDALQNFGDNANAITTWAMNSIKFFDLYRDGLTLNSDTLISGILYNATPATLNRAAYVTDSIGFNQEVRDCDNDGTNETKIYASLGLTSGAIVVQKSEPLDLVTLEDIDGENHVIKVSVEGAVTLKVKGYSWETTAGINPDDATLGTAANWRKVVDTKNTAGVEILTK
jgi:hypothetical protein